QVLIECRSPEEHRAHVRYVRYVPASYITIECSCIGEHPIHIRHAGYIPTAYVAIEQDCTGEHSAHIRYVGNVPAAYVCVKGGSTYEHILQIRNIRQIRGISGVALQIDRTCESPVHRRPLNIAPLLNGQNLFHIAPYRYGSETNAGE